jgi:hypothetical protein
VSGTSSRAEPEVRANRFIQAGYDHIILTQIGPDQAAFFDLFEREFAPALRERAAG